ncbi:NgoMIV family type II restriction endonuclease [Bifidobacterium longum]|uniref:NgoMIV family type II restriction endonuclease n=1 Tax=Bifidobacterium longum TaxID=216816 RepID=UPI0018E33F53|nr:NgoMIV family type II restriction endonuclease [Bifidobacterium longum]
MLAEERVRFHQELIDKGVIGFTAKKNKLNMAAVPSNADVDSAPSLEIADQIMRMVLDESQMMPHKPLSGQTLGKEFELAVGDFVRETFPKLQHIRPGKWNVERLGNASVTKEGSFSQYQHLADIDRIVLSTPELKAALGNDYVVAPDVIVARNLMSDDEINDGIHVVDERVGTYADLRDGEGRRPILHASISAKWTMRSDRAQNSRTEALNLIRNRKGRTPHIVIVTGEPLPSRIASLALGTGDIDCLYHAFLYELIEAVDNLPGREDSAEMVHTLVDGKRLKDITDLPLDLSV